MRYLQAFVAAAIMAIGFVVFQIVSNGLNDSRQVSVIETDTGEPVVRSARAQREIEERERLAC